MFDKKKFLDANKNRGFNSVEDGTYTCVLGTPKFRVSQKGNTLLNFPWTIDDELDEHNGEKVFQNISIKNEAGEELEQGYEIAGIVLSILGVKDMEAFVENQAKILEELTGTKARIRVETNDKGYTNINILGKTVKSTLEAAIGAPEQIETTEVVEQITEVVEQVTSPFDDATPKVETPVETPTAVVPVSNAIELSEGQMVLYQGQLAEIEILDTNNGIAMLKTAKGTMPANLSALDPDVSKLKTTKKKAEVIEEEEIFDEELDAPIEEGSKIVWRSGDNLAKGTVVKMEGNGKAIILKPDKKKIRISVRNLLQSSAKNIMLIEDAIKADA